MAILFTIIIRYTACKKRSLDLFYLLVAKYFEFICLKEHLNDAALGKHFSIMHHRYSQSSMLLKHTANSPLLDRRCMLHGSSKVDCTSSNKRRDRNKQHEGENSKEQASLLKKDRNWK